MSKKAEIELKQLSDTLKDLERQYQDMSQRLARLEPAQHSGRWTYNPESNSVMTHSGYWQESLVKQLAGI